jgi:hypothetical protein
MDVKEEVYEQILAILKDTKFPINSMEEMIAALPEGLDTTCIVGDVEVTAREVQSLVTEKDFPFKNAKHVADLLIERAGL